MRKKPPKIKPGRKRKPHDSNLSRRMNGLYSKWRRAHLERYRNRKGGRLSPRERGWLRSVIETELHRLLEHRYARRHHRRAYLAAYRRADEHWGPIQPAERVAFLAGQVLDAYRDLTDKMGKPDPVMKAAKQLFATVQSLSCAPEGMDKIEPPQIPLVLPYAIAEISGIKEWLSIEPMQPSEYLSLAKIPLQAWVDALTVWQSGVARRPPGHPPRERPPYFDREAILLKLLRTGVKTKRPRRIETATKGNDVKGFRAKLDRAEIIVKIGRDTTRY